MYQNALHLIMILLSLNFFGKANMVIISSVNGFVIKIVLHFTYPASSLTWHEVN